MQNPENDPEKHEGLTVDWDTELEKHKEMLED